MVICNQNSFKVFASVKAFFCLCLLAVNVCAGWNIFASKNAYSLAYSVLGQQNELFIGTPYGVLRFDQSGEVLGTYSTSNGLIFNKTIDLVFHEGRLYALSENLPYYSILCSDNGKWSSFLDEIPSQINQLKGLNSFGTHLVIEAEEGVVLFDKEKKKSIFFNMRRSEYPFFGESVIDTWTEGETLWTLTRDSLYRIFKLEEPEIVLVQDVDDKGRPVFTVDSNWYKKETVHLPSNCLTSSGSYGMINQFEGSENLLILRGGSLCVKNKSEQVFKLVPSWEGRKELLSYGGEHGGGQFLRNVNGDFFKLNLSDYSLSEKVNLPKGNFISERFFGGEEGYFFYEGNSWVPIENQYVQTVELPFGFRAVKYEPQNEILNYILEKSDQGLSLSEHDFDLCFNRQQKNGICFKGTDLVKADGTLIRSFLSAPGRIEGNNEEIWILLDGTLFQWSDEKIIERDVQGCGQVEDFDLSLVGKPVVLCVEGLFIESEGAWEKVFADVESMSQLSFRKENLWLIGKEIIEFSDPLQTNFNEFQRINLPFEEGEFSVKSLAVCQDESVWVTHSGFGLLHYSHNNWKQYFQKDGLGEDFRIDVKCGYDGTVYVLGTASLSILMGDSVVPNNMPNKNYDYQIIGPRSYLKNGVLFDAKGRREAPEIRRD